MAKLDVKGLRADVNKGGNRSDILEWTKDGSVVGFFDPRSGFESRYVHWLRYYGETEEVDAKTKQKRKIKKVMATPVNCPNGPDKDAGKCRVCALRKLLRENDDIDSNDIVLQVGEGRDMMAYAKGDILGEEGFDWQKDLRWNKEYLAGFIPVEKDGEPKAPKPFILIMSKTLGKAVIGVIDEQIDEEGEDKGNPLENPYAFKLKYDSAAMPSNKYDAVFMGKVPYTDGMREVFEAEDGAIDLSQMSTPALPADVDKLLAPYLVISVPGLGLEPGQEVDAEVEAPAKTKGKGAPPAKKPAAKPAAKKAVKVDDEPFGDDDDEGAEDGGEEEPEVEDDESPTPETDEDDEPAPAPVKPAAKPAQKVKATAAPAKPAAPAAPAAPAVQKVAKVSKGPAKPVEPTDLVTARAAGEQIDECPLCHKDVPASAVRCCWDGCGAEYESDDEAGF